VSEWVSVTEAAEILGVSRSTVLRSLQDPQRRAVAWGAEGDGWRRKPLSPRGDYQLRRSRVLEKAGG